MRPVLRLWPIVELIGLVAAVLTLLSFAFGRDQQAEQPTPTVAPTQAVTPTTAPVTPTSVSGLVGDCPMLGCDPSRTGGADRAIPAQAPTMRWTTSLAPNIRFPIAAGDAVCVTDGATLFALDAAGATTWLGGRNRR